MERSYFDDISDVASVVSQDRFSDDTDFLIGHNISFNNLNDSYLDAKSSTTTDLLYQQGINDAEIGVKKITNQKNSNSSIDSPAKSISSPGKIDIDPKGNQSIFEGDYYNSRNASLSFSKEKHIDYRIDHKYEDKIIEDVGLPEEDYTYNTFDQDPKEKIASDSKIKDRSSSLDASKSAEVSKTSKNSKDSSSNWKYRSVDGFSDEDSMALGKNSNTTTKVFAESYSQGLPESDPKVKEGEELLARLLGKVTLSESLRSHSTVTRKDSYQQAQDTKWTDNQVITGSASQASASPQRHSIGSNEIPASESKASSTRSDRKDQEWRKTERQQNVTARSAETKAKATVRTITSPFSDRSEPSRGSAASLQYTEMDFHDRSRASSMEKYQRKQIVDVDMATSTPHKTSWPVSPIKRNSNPEVEESETLLAKNNGKLKELKVAIEQEVLRKEAILRERTSAEESLIQVKKNIQSLEQLAEEHRKQTVSTRTELMELEQQRNTCQREFNEVMEDLKIRKKELESLPEELKESNISTKIAMLQDERDELKRECKILREKSKDADHANNTNMELMRKMRNLQEQLYNEQDSSREKIRAIREELENERRKAVEANIEQMSTIRKIREESMEAKKMEVDAVIEKLEKEKVVEIESINSRYQREIKRLHQKIEEIEDDNQKLVTSNSDRLNKAQEQSERNHRREIENTIKKIKKENESEVATLSHRHKRQTEELDLQLKSKQSEIENLQALLKQQAESTRLLGEKLRSEAKDQICLAVEKERDSRLEELRRTELELERVREERDMASSGSNTELADKESENERLRSLINKIKKELEDARQENYEAREEKLQAISKTRSEMKEECDRVKMKLRELEKIEQTIILEINEESLKSAAVTGGSYPTVKRNYSFDAEDSNPVGEALVTLRLSNNDLRKLVMKYKKKFEESRASNESLNRTNKSDRDSSMERSCTPDRARTPDRNRTPDRMHTPDGLKINGSSDESKSAKILRHLQSRVKQLRQGNESMKRSFGSDDLENELDSSAGSAAPDQGENNISFSTTSAETQRLETALKGAEEQAQKYANLLNQKMVENTKLQRMLTQASKENIKLERLHSILQHKVATGATS